MENKIEKANTMWLMLVWTYIAAAVYILLYGEFSKIAGQFYCSMVKTEIGF